MIRRGCRLFFIAEKRNKTEVKSIYKITKIRPGILTKSSRDTIGDFSTYPMSKD